MADASMNTDRATEGLPVSGGTGGGNVCRGRPRRHHYQKIALSSHASAARWAATVPVTIRRVRVGVFAGACIPARLIERGQAVVLCFGKALALLLKRPFRESEMRPRRTKVRRKLPPPEFIAWEAIVERGCCIRWRCYANFRRDVGQKPSWRHLLVRIDTSRPFSPGNARWRAARRYRSPARR
jgi:hypothetical protein